MSATSKPTIPAIPAIMISPAFRASSAIRVGINLVYYVNQQQLEYDFLVTPGAHPRAIRHFPLWRRG
jgi:hypothetical protein